MPNWCWNTLSINATNDSKEAEAQLKKFVSDVRDEGEAVKNKEASEHRDKFIADNFEVIYRNDAKKFILHSEMHPRKFMEDVLGFTYEEDEEKYTKGKEEFSMSKILPIPTEYTIEEKSPVYKKEIHSPEALLKKYGSKDWYDWNVNNWGTKWDVTDVHFDEDNGFLTYGFDSAWSPPVEFLKNICSKYPLLNFSLYYEEGGCDFEGDLEIVAGIVTKDETRKFSNHSCNECGDNQSDLDEGDTINDNGLCPSCQEAQDDDKNEE